jgi:hypothetical protein
LNYGKNYTVEHNLKVYDFGMVSKVRNLKTVFREIEALHVNCAIRMLSQNEELGTAI